MGVKSYQSILTPFNFFLLSPVFKSHVACGGGSRDCDVEADTTLADFNERVSAHLNHLGLNRVICELECQGVSCDRTSCPDRHLGRAHNLTDDALLCLYLNHLALTIDTVNLGDLSTSPLQPSHHRRVSPSTLREIVCGLMVMREDGGAESLGVKIDLLLSWRALLVDKWKIVMDPPFNFDTKPSTTTASTPSRTFSVALDGLIERLLGILRQHHSIQLSASKSKLNESNERWLASLPPPPLLPIHPLLQDFMATRSDLSNHWLELSSFGDEFGHVENDELSGRGDAASFCPPLLNGIIDRLLESILSLMRGNYRKTAHWLFIFECLKLVRRWNQRQQIKVFVHSLLFQHLQNLLKSFDCRSASSSPMDKLDNVYTLALRHATLPPDVFEECWWHILEFADDKYLHSQREVPRDSSSSFLDRRLLIMKQMVTSCGRKLELQLEAGVSPPQTLTHHTPISALAIVALHAIFLLVQEYVDLGMWQEGVNVLRSHLTTTTFTSQSPQLGPSMIESSLLFKHLPLRHLISSWLHFVHLSLFHSLPRDTFR